MILHVFLDSNGTSRMRFGKRATGLFNVSQMTFFYPTLRAARSYAEPDYPAGDALPRMFDTIILMTGPAEQPSLASVLRDHNPRLTICPVASLAELGALEPHFHRARLVSFVNSVVVPSRVLDALGFGAYNFHPGPPDYPGRVPSHFALYDRATIFGATAHAMIERVDAGMIIGVELFPIPPNATIERLEELAFAHSARLFWQHAEALATQPEPLPVLPTTWSGRKSSRRLHAAMCDIPTEIAKDELDRRIAAFGAGHYGLNPTITLHGHQFRYVKPDTDVEADSPSIVPAEQLETQDA